MQKVSTFPRATLFNWIAKQSRTLKTYWQDQSTAKTLSTLSRDRLDDIGIAPKSDANHRNSGEAGPIPQAPLW